MGGGGPSHVEKLQEASRSFELGLRKCSELINTERKSQSVVASMLIIDITDFLDLFSLYIGGGFIKKICNSWLQQKILQRDSTGNLGYLLFKSWGLLGFLAS